MGLSGDDDEDWSVDGVDEAAEPQMEDDEEWDSLGEAINAQGEEMWEDLDVQLSGPRKKRRGGRVLKWDREVCDEMPLREEVRLVSLPDLVILTAVVDPGGGAGVLQLV